MKPLAGKELSKKLLLVEGRCAVSKFTGSKYIKGKIRGWSETIILRIGWQWPQINCGDDFCVGVDMHLQSKTNSLEKS